MAYTLLVERLERHVLNERLVIGIVAPWTKQESVDLPTWDTALAEFTEALNAEPQPVTEQDADKAALLRAVGLRG